MSQAAEEAADSDWSQIRAAFHHFGSLHVLNAKGNRWSQACAALHAPTAQLVLFSNTKDCLAASLTCFNPGKRFSARDLPKSARCVALRNGLLYECDDYLTQPHAFEVRSPIGVNFFAAPSPAELRDWLDAMCYVGVVHCSAQHEHLFASSASENFVGQHQRDASHGAGLVRFSKQGYLEKRGWVNTNFKKRFFRVVENARGDSLLAYYASHTDQDPKGTIDLSEQSCAVRQDDGCGLFVKTMHPKLGEREFHLRAPTKEVATTWRSVLRYELHQQRQRRVAAATGEATATTNEEKPVAAAASTTTATDNWAHLEADDSTDPPKLKAQNHYEVLSLAVTVTQQDVGKAVRRAMAANHPDNDKSKQAQQRFEAIHAASEVLQNEDSRRQYDIDTFGRSFKRVASSVPVDSPKRSWKKRPQQHTPSSSSEAHQVSSIVVYDDFTAAEKQQLGEDIQRLDADQLGPIIAIIQNNLTDQQQKEAGDIEVDLDTLGPVTLRQLQSYVKSALSGEYKPPSQSQLQQSAATPSATKKSAVVSSDGEQMQFHDRAPNDAYRQYGGFDCDGICGKVKEPFSFGFYHAGQEDLCVACAKLKEDGLLAKLKQEGLLDVSAAAQSTDTLPTPAQVSSRSRRSSTKSNADSDTFSSVSSISGLSDTDDDDDDEEKHQPNAKQDSTKSDANEPAPSQPQPPQPQASHTTQKPTPQPQANHTTQKPTPPQTQTSMTAAATPTPTTAAVATAPQPTDSPHDADDLRQMAGGFDVIKVPRSGKPKTTTCFVERDPTNANEFVFRWHSKKKKPRDCQVTLSKCKFCQGQQTPLFKKHSKTLGSKSWLSFSIVAPKRHIDIVFDEEDLFDTVSTAVQAMCERTLDFA